MRFSIRGDGVKVALLDGTCKAVDGFECLDIGDEQAAWTVANHLAVPPV